MTTQGIWSEACRNAFSQWRWSGSAAKIQEQCRSPICHGAAGRILRLLAYLWMSTTLGQAGQPTAASWRGVLRDGGGARLSGAAVELQLQQRSEVLTRR